MVPISNWAAFGNAGAKDMIVWLPIDVIATTVQGLVQLRKELIDDVYQITGLSDIMRGSTEASETATAQNLKAQYGSVRIRDRQAELVRVARDIARIVAEIMAENFSPKTLLEMSQFEIKTNAQIAQEVQQVVQAAQPQAIQIRQAAQQNPQAAQQAQQMLSQLEQQTKAQVDKINQQPTIEKVMALLREQKLRPFVLDIETDSTIQPDEDAQKQRATEFVTAVGAFLKQAVEAVQQVPQIAPLMSDTLKFVAGQFRAGRELEGSIDEFADQMKQMAGQQKGPTPEQLKAQSDAKLAEAQLQQDGQKMQMDHDKAMGELKVKSDQQQIELRKAELSSLTSIEVARIAAKQDSDSNMISSQLEALLGFAQIDHEKVMQAADHAQQQMQTAADQAHEQDMNASDQAHEQDMTSQGQAFEADQAQQAREAEPAA
jgi:hypothetical protein